MRVISALRMRPFVLDNWRRLPLPGKLVGDIGQPTLHLWDLIRTYNRQPLNNKFAASQDLPSVCAQDTMDEDDRYRLQQLQAQLLPLGRGYLRKYAHGRTGTHMERVWTEWGEY
jgi:hypothetical protein